MSVWESVGSSYVEAVANALPLHRLVIFLVGVGASLAVKTQTHLSIVETIARVKVADLSSLSSGPLASTTLGDLLLGIGAVAVAWIASRVAIRSIFALAARGTNLWARATEAVARTSDIRVDSMADRQATINFLDESLKETRIRLKGKSALSELTMGLAIIFIATFQWGNSLDLVCGTLILTLSVALHMSTVSTFLSDYFGIALYKSQLQGKRPPTPLDN